MNRTSCGSNTASAFRAVLIALSLVVIALAAGSNAHQARADSSGLAYDELMRINFGGIDMGNMASPPPNGQAVTPPPASSPEPGVYANGSFAADFKAAIDAGATPKPHGGMFGQMLNAANMAKSAMAMIHAGTPSTHYFLNGWERNDDPAHQTADIYRGDLRQKIHLDLANKTYSITDLNEQAMAETPPPMPSRNPQQQYPSPQPGTAKVAITATTSALGPKTIDSVPTNGYKQQFKLTSTEAQGSCTDGSFGTTMIEYVSKYAEPAVAMPSGKTAPKQSMMSNPEMASVKPGCKPKVTARTHLGPTPPSGRLAMWEMLTIDAGMMAQGQGQSQGQGQHAATFGTVIERGNVRALGAADKSLFEIPPGYTKVDATQ